MNTKEVLNLFNSLTFLTWPMKPKLEKESSLPPKQNPLFCKKKKEEAKFLNTVSNRETKSKVFRHVSLESKQKSYSVIVSPSSVLLITCSHDQDNCAMPFSSYTIRVINLDAPNEPISVPSV